MMAQLDLEPLERFATALQTGTATSDEFREWYSNWSVGWRSSAGGKIADTLANVDMALLELDLHEFEDHELGGKLMQITENIGEYR